MARQPLTSATADHVADFFARGPRPIDAAEWHLATGTPLTEESFKSALGTTPAHATLDDEGRCVALYGAIPDVGSPQYGNLWLLTTEAADNPLTPAEAAALAEPFSALVAFAHPDNHPHQAQLETLGFDRMGSLPIGPTGTDFAAFVLHNPEAR